jgi:hypothetical protein
MVPVWSCAATMRAPAWHEELGRRRAHVAEALHRHARAVQRQRDAPRGLAPGDEDAAPGGLHAARASRPGRPACRVTTPVAVAPTFIE